MFQQRLLLLVLLLALVARLGLIALLNPQGFYFSDARHYDQAATSILAGEGWGDQYNRAPFYPLVMAAVYAVFGHSFTAVRVIEACAALLLCLIIFQIARRIVAPKTALAAAALAAIYPHFLLVSVILYPTHLFTVLLMGSIYGLILYSENMKWIFLFMSSLCAALAALTIPAFFFILPFLLLWVLFEPQGWRRKVGGFVLYVLVFTAVLTPWTVHNYQKYGRLTLSQPVPHTVFPDLNNLEGQKQQIENGFTDTTEYFKQHPSGTEQDRLDRIISQYLHHPLQSIKYMVSELGHFWALYPDRLDTQSSTYQKSIQKEDQRMMTTSSTLWRTAKIISILFMAPIFLFALMGFIASFPLNSKSVLLLGSIVCFSFGYSLIYAEVRYRIPIEPFVLIFTAHGIFFSFEKLKMNFQLKSIARQSHRGKKC